MELSLSPFHTGKLFDAPIFRAINSTAGGLGVIKEMSGTRLKLGEVQVNGLSSDVPGRGDSSEATPRSRVGIAELKEVYKPHRGVKPSD